MCFFTGASSSNAGIGAFSSSAYCLPPSGLFAQLGCAMIEGTATATMHRGCPGHNLGMLALVELCRGTVRAEDALPLGPLLQYIVDQCTQIHTSGGGLNAVGGMTTNPSQHAPLSKQHVHQGTPRKVHVAVALQSPPEACAIIGSAIANTTSTSSTAAATSVDAVTVEPMSLCFEEKLLFNVAVHASTGTGMVTLTKKRRPVAPCCIAQLSSLALLGSARQAAQKAGKDVNHLVAKIATGMKQLILGERPPPILRKPVQNTEGEILSCREGSDAVNQPDPKLMGQPSTPSPLNSPDRLLSLFVAAISAEPPQHGKFSTNDGSMDVSSKDAKLKGSSGWKKGLKRSKKKDSEAASDVLDQGEEALIEKQSAGAAASTSANVAAITDVAVGSMAREVGC